MRRDLLPEVVAPGTPFGPLRAGLAASLGLGPGCMVVAGTTDGCASFLATGADAIGAGVTVLGTTLTLKLLSDVPVFAPEHGVYSHRLGDRWLVGGASNSGGKALLRFFTAERMAELTPQLRPDQPTGLHWHPLPGRGERFPVADPALEFEPEPRPADDARLFQALLEGIAEVEARAYALLAQLGGAAAALGPHGRRRCRQHGLDGDPPAPAAGADAPAGQPGARLRHGTPGAPGGDGRVRPAALAELAAFSARIGRDPEQVQAAGGNTSLKQDGLLWVKASGLWLADALERDLFVPVRLDAVLQGIDADAADPVSAAVASELNPEGLRPSIETTLHALLPHRIVVHTHSVRTIALAIRADGEARIAERLTGLRWAWVPYRKPGLPLTRAVAEKLAGGSADVLVLGNHGLVVGGGSVTEAASLLAEVERRLDAPVQPIADRLPRHFTGADSTRRLRAPTHARTHALAMDPGRLAWATAGSLYPDHVIFLGPAAGALDGRADAGPALARGTKLFLAPGEGAFLAGETTVSADELALCLALVLERVPADATLRYLTAEDEAELLDWDAEKYRQNLARARAG